MIQDIICPGPLTDEALSAALAEFVRTVRPERERLLDYYRGVQPVPKGAAVQGRPNNLLRVPYPRYITEVHTGYFFGQPPTLTFAQEDEGALFDRLSGEMGLFAQLYDLARDLSVCGVGFFLVWLERQGLRACRCDPLSCFALRANTADNALLGTVRLYQAHGRETAGVLYTAEALRPFLWDGTALRWSEPEENLFHAIPLLPFYNNAEGSGDFESVAGLVDEYNLLLSGAMDDMQSVANAFLALFGMQGTTQKDIDRANKTRILALTEGGRAEFVVKNLNHEALSMLETNLRRSILQMSMTPDLSDEHFSGNASGVALQYKLWGIEQVRSGKERAFTAGLRSLLKLLAAGITALGTPVRFEGTPVFYKNLPQNNTELAETLLSLEPLLSRRTILKNLPWVTDVEQELRDKQAESNQL